MLRKSLLSKTSTVLSIWREVAGVSSLIPSLRLVLFVPCVRWATAIAVTSTVSRTSSHSVITTGPSP